MTTQNEMPDEIYLYKHFTSVSPMGCKFDVELYAAQEDQSEGIRYIRADLTQPAGDVGKALDDEFHKLCSQCWEALGITEYTGKHIVEHIRELRALSQQLTKPQENVSCADLSNVGEALGKLSDPNFDWSSDCDGKLSYDEWVVKTAQSAKNKTIISAPINLIDDMCRAYWGDKAHIGWDNHPDKNFKNEMRDGMSDVLDIVKSALSQQPDAGLLDALKRSYTFIESYDGETAVAKRMFLNFLKQAIARAEQKGGC